VADPRRIDIARYADIHLQHKPGTDLALLNGLMHIILREGWEDEAFIESRTEGFEEFASVIAKYTP
jgi:anaerobic selenocysteine-containing dehydrogenase